MPNVAVRTSGLPGRTTQRTSNHIENGAVRPAEHSAFDSTDVASRAVAFPAIGGRVASIVGITVDSVAGPKR